MRSSLKTLLNFKDDEIITFQDCKRIEVEKSLSNLKLQIDESNETGSQYFVFVYYVGNYAMIDSKVQSVHNAVANEKKKSFGIE